ncbi:MAG: nitroreductase family protein [Caldilineaceae bacterium]|nr:nitroreductase family protein [Caldilineaceae bacterium]
MVNDPALDIVAASALPASPDEVPFWSLIRGRRSIRRYADRPIARATLEALLEAARWAPSAHNRQPWRFCVVTDQATKLELSRRMTERWRADLLRDGASPDFAVQRTAVSHARITGAGALILTALSMDDMDDYPDARRAEAECTMAVQSVALACQNLLLAAYHYGLGACWMCAPLFAPDLVRDVLDLPGDWQPQALITLGYPAEEKVKDRAAMATRVIWR